MSTIELKGLRGLEGLLNDSKQTNTSLSVEKIYHLPLNKLKSGKYQPRKEIDENSLHDLATSIKSQGIIQPIITRKIDDEFYEIIAGERRWKAAQIAELTEIPVIIRNVSDETALAFALIENIQREDLNPIDQALAFSRLRDEFGMKHHDIAQNVGFSRSTITNILRLLTLTDYVKQALIERKIEIGHAKLLLVLDDDLQALMVDKIINNNLSVRETEKIIQHHKKRTANLDDDIENNNILSSIKDWNRILSQKLSSIVKVRLNKKGEGSVNIRVNSIEEVEWLIENISIRKKQ